MWGVSVSDGAFGIDAAAAAAAGWGGGKTYIAIVAFLVVELATAGRDGGGLDGTDWRRGGRGALLFVVCFGRVAVSQKSRYNITTFCSCIGRSLLSAFLFRALHTLQPAG